MTSCSISPSSASRVEPLISPLLPKSAASSLATQQNLREWQNLQLVIEQMFQKQNELIHLSFEALENRTNAKIAELSGKIDVIQQQVHSLNPPKASGSVVSRKRPATCQAEEEKEEESSSEAKQVLSSSSSSLSPQIVPFVPPPLPSQLASSSSSTAQISPFTLPSLPQQQVLALNPPKWSGVISRKRPSISPCETEEEEGGFIEGSPSEGEPSRRLELEPPLATEIRLLNTVFPTLSACPQATEQETQTALLAQIAKILSQKTPQEITTIRQSLTKLTCRLKEKLLSLCDVYQLSLTDVIDSFSKRAYGGHEITLPLVSGAPLSVQGYLPPSLEVHEKDKARLVQIMEAYALQFGDELSEQVIKQGGGGIIEKRHLETNDQTLSRADFHSDLPSLIGLIQFAPNIHFCDRDLQKFQKGKHIFLLGDYTDRGINDIEVLTLVFLLRMKHPESITLLRGNHEEETILGAYSVESEFFTKHKELLARCHATMPLAVCSADQHGVLKNGVSQVQYLHSSHALFSPAANLSNFLEGPEKRIVLPPNLEFRPLSTTATTKAQAAFDQLKADISKVAPPLNQALCITATRTYNWGDTGCENGYNTARPILSATTIQLYKRANTTGKSKIGRFERGHKHEFQEIFVNGKAGQKKCLVTTLPVGSVGGYYSNFKAFTDCPVHAVLRTVQPKLRMWTKQAIGVSTSAGPVPQLKLLGTAVLMDEPLLAALAPPPPPPTTTLPPRSLQSNPFPASSSYSFSCPPPPQPVAPLVSSSSSCSTAHTKSPILPLAAPAPIVVPFVPPYPSQASSSSSSIQSVKSLSQSLPTSTPPPILRSPTCQSSSSFPTSLRLSSSIPPCPFVGLSPALPSVPHPQVNFNGQREN